MVRALLLLLLTMYSAVAALAQTKPVAVANGHPTIVLVHGAWGGSWDWRRVDSLLTGRGYNVYRPALTGQGERVHLASPEVGLSTHINDVVNTILFEDLHDIILVGHSYGGMVITGVADRVPDRIRQVIYLDAFVPNDGDNAQTLFGARWAGLKATIANGFVVPAWVKPDQQPPKDVPQPLGTFTEPIVLKNAAARQLPTRYILTVDAGKRPQDDDFYAQAERARQRGWPVQQITADHNAQRTAPQALVELLDQR